MNYQQQIQSYQPFNEQEKTDKQVMLKACIDFDHVLTRQSIYAHFTATAFAVNPERTKILMVHHNLFQTWVEPGGHADGEEDLQKVALKELQEETGIQKAKPIGKDIFSIQVDAIKGHEKRGCYVSSHLHLDTTFLFEVEETEELKMREGENTKVKWIPLEKMEQYSEDSWYNERIYTKLKAKLEKYH